MKIMKKAVSILLTLTMVLTIFTVVPVTVSAASQSVTYVDENGETQTVTADILTGAETELSPGWYAVTEDIRFEDMVNLSAPDSAKDINLILCDGATMLLTNEMQGFYSDDSVSLNIYGQSSGSGALKSQGGDFIFLMSPNASLNIFGGELTSSYINADYCTITCAGDINISGGSVEKCELVSYNNLTVSGGSVNVPYLMADQTVRFEGGSVNIGNDGIYAGSIVFSLRDGDSSVKSTAYDASSVSTEWYLTDGSNTYSIGEISNPSALNNKTLKTAGHVHTFSEPTWAWDGYEAATATFVCSECGETVVETATVTDEITKAPTESETGITTYTATVTVNGTAYTDTKTKTTHVGNHTFGTPQWDWNGYEAATVTVTCTIDGDSFTADAVITSEVTAEPTLTSEGKRVYTATATVEGQTFTDTKEETLPKITRDVSVSYRALNNKDVTVTAQKLYGDETELTDGWYAVTDDLTIDYRPNCTGTVNLILCDGVTFNANKGINVGDNATLTVWGQSEGTGVLNAGYIANGACIGTSSSMNSAGNVNININGGQYVLNPTLYDPAVGGYRGHTGTVTVNRGTLGLKSTYSRYAPFIGFLGDLYGQSSDDYTVNIRGGNINAGTVDSSVAIGCHSSAGAFVNISGGTVTASAGPESVGIGSYAADNCTVNISGGFVTVRDATGMNNNEGIGVYSPGSCSIIFRWTSLNNCEIFSFRYNGQISLYKDFKNKSTSAVIPVGDYDSDDIQGKTLVPYCTHSYGEPAWTWNTDSEPFTASASFLCSECGDYQTVDADVAKTRSLTENIYTGSITFKGETYTDECETRTSASMNLTVGGVRVTRDNAADILGDGKVSYDVATNTLTLDNAEIPCVLDNDTAYGINYYDTADAFNIVLIGKNTIVYQDSNSGFFVRFDDDTDAYTIMGGGSLSFDMQSTSSSNNQYIGIYTEKPLTIDNASVNWEYLNQYNTAFGIWLESDASLTLRDYTDVSLCFGYYGFTSNSVALYSSGSAIDVDETSSLALNATSSAISGSVTLSDSTMNLGASVAKNYRPGDAYSTWDKTTALSTYNAIHIPDDVSTHTITVVNAPNGYESIYPLQHKVGDTVEITASPESGYGFAYMKLKRADDGTETKIYAKEFTMPACDVTVTPVFNPVFEYSEPYMTDDLDYVPGHVRHYEDDGKNYAILDNGCMGEKIDPYFTYFTFENINSETSRITKYTGSTNGLTELVIPKTYNGRKVTELGSGANYSPLISYRGNLTVVLNENIVRINNYAFYNTMVMRVTGDTSSLISIGEEAFYRALNNRRLYLNLFYPGNVELGKWSLMNGYVTVHLKHTTTLSLNDVQANSITYDFIDDHIYGDDPEPTWTWADDYSSAAASFTCSDERCQHREVIDATVSGAVDGEEHTFTATVTFDGKTYTDTKAVSGHAYGEPVWRWSADHSAASAAFACTKTGCDHSETVAAEVTSDFTGDAGHVFTATAQFNGESYTDTVTFPHTYDDPSWSWSDDLSTASVTLTCTDADCQHQKTLSAAITDTQSENVHRFSAYVMYEGMPYVDMHTFGEPMWVWNEDKSSATATFTCSDTGCEYSRTIDAALTDEVDGELCTITATVTFGSFTYTDTAEIELGRTLVERTEPYIDDDGAYIVGNVAYYAIGGKYYAVNEDGDVGDELNTVELSYFTYKGIDAETCQITEYTGPTDGLTELVIPKTYNGRKVTELGSGTAYSPLISYQGNLTVVLNENIVRINRYAFYNTMVMRVTGDTSSLIRVGEYAFMRALNNRELHLNLFYPGNVELDTWSLKGGYVTVHLKHATTLSLNDVQANSITYDFIDDHIYGDDPEPTWTWAGDYSYATAAFNCAESRCTHQETLDTTVSVETADGNYIYTAACEFNGETYTDTVTVPIGDEENPFVIHNKADWIAFAEKINAGYYTTSYYKLADDFDNSDPITTTVGTSDHPFEGHFDGNGKTLNIALNDTANQGTAPFRYISGADIHDMTVIGSVSGNRHAAGLIGFNGGTSTITDITVNANISATANGEGYIGGVIGHNKTAALTMTNVVYGGTLNNRGNYAGGLFGWSDNSTVTMTDCLFKGSYTGSGSFHPVGCKNASDTVSVTLDRVYYTVDPNFSNSSNILSNDGIRVYTEAPDDRIVGTVRAADGEDYYIPASVSGVESEYDYVITEITPTVTVTAYDGTVLERGIDYTVTYDPATVRTAGDYTVTVTGIGDFAGVYTASFTVTGHNYDDYEWEWSEDLATATLVMKCTDDGCDIESRIPSTVSSKISKGVHVYTAFVFLYGTPYVDSQVGSHTYGDPVWSWSEDYQTATAAFTCTDARCGHAEIVDAAVTKSYTADSTVYTARATVNGTEYTDTKTVDGKDYFTYHSLSLNGAIGVNFYLNIPSLEGYSIKFTFRGAEYDGEIEHNPNGYYANFPIDIPELTDTIKAELYQNGELVDTDEYKAAQYAKAAQKLDNTALNDLLKAMHLLGSVSQTYFKHNEDDLADKAEYIDISDVFFGDVTTEMIREKISETYARPENINSDDVFAEAGLRYYGSSVVLNDMTKLKIYFTIVDKTKFEAHKDSFTLSINGGEESAITPPKEVVSNTVVCFEIDPGVPAAELDNTYIISLGDAKYYYSALDYAAKALANSDTKLQELGRAMYWYNYYADRFFDTLDIPYEEYQASILTGRY